MAFPLASLLTLLLAAAPAADLAPAKAGAAAAPPRLLAYNWAGDGFAVRASPTATIVQGKCASGKIAGPIRLDRAGAFVATGYFNSPRTGLRLDDIAARDRPAKFSGKVSGDTLLLKVEYQGNPRASYVLRRDASFVFQPCP